MIVIRKTCYITIGVDLSKNSTFHAVNVKEDTTIKEIKDYLVIKGYPKEQIKQVSIDSSPTFIAVKVDNFRN